MQGLSSGLCEKREGTMTTAPPSHKTVCQSCAMPLSVLDDFGTDANGGRMDDYCVHCMRNGAFTDPDLTQQGMIDRCGTLMARKGIMPEAQARTVMAAVIPQLKRWRKADDGAARIRP